MRSLGPAVALVVGCSSPPADRPPPIAHDAGVAVAVAPPIAPPSPPFELPPPADPIVDLSPGCVTRKSGHADCWQRGAIDRLPGIDDAIAIRGDEFRLCVVRPTAVTCEALTTNNPNEVVPKFGGLVDPVSVVVGYPTCVLEKRGAVTCWNDTTKRPMSMPHLAALALVTTEASATCAIETSRHIACTFQDSARHWRRVPKLAHVALLGFGLGGGDNGDWYADGCAVLVDGQFSCFQLTGHEAGPIRIGKAEVGGGPPEADWPTFRGATALWMSSSRVTAIVGGKVVVWDGSGAGTRTLDHVADAVAITGQCALRAQGSVVCWGDNSDGELGQRLPARVAAPVPVVGVADVVSVAIGDHAGWAVRRDGAVFHWGDGKDGWAVADDRFAPATAVALGPRSIDTPCFVQRGGAVACARYMSTARAILAVHDVTAVDTDNGQFIALRADGSAVRWTIPTGDEAAVEVHPITGVTNATQIAGDPTLTCFRDKAGVASCATHTCPYVDGRYQCKDGEMQRVLDHVTELAIYGGTACARVAAGDVVCWGRNNFGELGRAGSADPQPKPVAAAHGAIALHAHEDGFCAELTDGSLVCWGGRDHPDPHAVLPKGSLAGGFVGGETGCTITPDRRAACWGDNSHGELGNGAIVYLAQPAAVPGL